MVEEQVSFISFFLPDVLKAMKHVDFLYLLEAPSILKARGTHAPWNASQGLGTIGPPEQHLSGSHGSQLCPSNVFIYFGIALNFTTFLSTAKKENLIINIILGTVYDQYGPSKWDNSGFIWLTLKKKN